MKLSEFIEQAKNQAAGYDPEIVLYDRANAETHRVWPELDQFDFDVLGGRDEIVIEFN